VYFFISTTTVVVQAQQPVHRVCVCVVTTELTHLWSIYLTCSCSSWDCLAQQNKSSATPGTADRRWKADFDWKL